MSKCRKCGVRPIYVCQEKLVFPYTVYHYPNKKICDNKFCWHADSEDKAITKWNEHNGQ